MALALRVRAGAGLGRIWLPLLIVYLVWGSTYLGIRLAIDTIPPLLMAGVRFSVAGAILYAFSIGRGETQRDRPGRVQWVAALLIGALLLFGGNGGVVLAERSIPTGIAALLVAPFRCGWRSSTGYSSATGSSRSPWSGFWWGLAASLSSWAGRTATSTPAAL